MPRILMVPDPLYRADQLSAAAILWFGELAVSLPAQVVTPESFAILDEPHTRAALWNGPLSTTLGGLVALRRGTDETLAALGDLRDRLEVLWLVYAGDSAAMERARSLINASGLERSDLLSMVDLPVAYGELARHVFLERWLEVDRDLPSFRVACSEVFDPVMFEDRLVEAYLLRVGALRGAGSTSYLLSNVRLLDFLWRCWQLDGTPDSSAEDSQADIDAVGYEILRHLVSPRLDPLDSRESALTTSVLLATKRDEIDALRRQCLRLAESMPGVPYSRLETEVTSFVELHVQEELGALLDLSSRALQDYIVGLMSDRPAWLSLLSTIAGLASGTPGFTVAGRTVAGTV